MQHIATTSSNGATAVSAQAARRGMRSAPENPNYIGLAEDAQIRAEIASAEFEMDVDSHRCFGSPDRLNATSVGRDA